MLNPKRLLRDTLGGLLFNELEVANVQALGPRFRLLELSGRPLRQFTPGAKLQLMLDEGSRTYTPFEVDSEAGTLSLLVYLHGNGPGSQWASSARQGTRVMAFGPRASIDLPRVQAPTILVGDETSIALATLFEQHHRGSATLLEVTSVDETRLALDALELERVTLVQRQVGDAHRSELGSSLLRLQDTLGAASAVLTGNARTIQSVRSGLRDARSRGKQTVKAYWAPGKRGLD
ncbi:MAG: siderophore-interacting protein [Polyangiaceae bacterium]|nr:siderophore-interacting protein [Myxococcales bacterium]MCB9584584.1 siderophore-interacting protein [Polyangiaceae bacterium]